MLFVGVFAARFVGLSGSIVQLRSEPAMRTRAVALWSTAFIGSSLLGAPIVGWIGETAGPQWAMYVALVGGVVAAGIGWWGSRGSQEALVDALPAAANLERKTG
jgi:MFS family permease